MDQGQSPVRAAAVGDLMLGDTAISVGFGFASRHPDGIERLPERLQRLFSGDDVVLGNLECALSRLGYRRDDWRRAQMRGYPAYAPALRSAGFTHLSVANNHITQHGREAFDETVEVLRQAGIEVCGLPGEGAWYARPVRSLVRGRPVCVLAYSLRPSRYDSGEPPYARAEPPQVLADVARCEPGDAVVVSMHWGEEYGEQPSAEEVVFARALVDSGAALVVGHHPHVLRPVQRYHGGVIAYSLGNFISNMTWRRVFRETAVLRCDLRDPSGTVEVEPAWIDDDFLPGPQRRSGLAPVDDVVGLDPRAYRRQTGRTEGLQSRAAYLHALRHIAHFHPAVLRQLVRTTLGNKVGHLLGRD